MKVKVKVAGKEKFGSIAKCTNCKTILAGCWEDTKTQMQARCPKCGRWRVELRLPF